MFYMACCTGVCHSACDIASDGADQCAYAVCHGRIYRTCRVFRYDAVFSGMGNRYSCSSASGGRDNFPGADPSVFKKSGRVLYRRESYTGNYSSVFFI